MVDELNRLKRWIYGRRSEKISEAEGQQHLFDLESSAIPEPAEHPESVLTYRLEESRKKAARKRDRRRHRRAGRKTT